MNTETLQSLVRQILTFVGGFFVAKGTITAETLTAIVTNITTIIGSVAVLVSVWWSWLAHRA